MKTPRDLFIVAALIAAGFLAPSLAQSPDSQVYQNPSAPLEVRVNDLIGRMTLEEKVSQLTHEAPAIDRLGVPAYNWWNEGLHGVARAGRATVFPQAIGLAATWDTSLMRQVAVAISDEARAKHHEFVRRGQRGIYQGLTFWSPNINIFRDPRWGRGMETYGEDPWLAGRLAVEFVRGLQGDDPRYLKTVATPKHFAVHSGPEPDRHTFDAVIGERDLRETYLPQFEMAVREGGALSVMCSYNRYLGVPACSSSYLLDQVLRKEWGFTGYVVSDCGAIDDIYQTHKVAASAAEASAMGVHGGCDISCGSTYKSLLDAVKQRLVSEDDLNTALRRLFTVRFRLGMFDPPGQVPYAQIPYSVVDSPAHQALALQAARNSIVLLKNEGGLLPLKPGYKTVAVIGPNADDEEVLLGNYNGTPTRTVTPLQGLRARLGPATTVLYEQGTDWADNLPSLEVVPSSALRTSEGGRVVPGLTGAYFNAPVQGAPATSEAASLKFPALGADAVLTRVDSKIDFHWLDRQPDAKLAVEAFAVRWTGQLVAPETGTYQLGGYGHTGFRLYLDDELLVEFRNSHEANKRAKAVLLEAGRRYRIRIEYFNRHTDARFQLLWSRPVRRLEEKAMAAARRADLIVAVMGLSPRLEGEEMNVPVEGFKGGDRIDIGLPAAQDRLLRALVGTGKPVVLVLLNGSAVAATWAAEHVPAIVEAWYPGQAAGTALADVLAGDVNPAGRLPVTFYASARQLPPFGDYAMAGRTYRYFKGEPLFPFGFGLSYTTFAYRALTLPATAPVGQPVAVSVEVENTGTRSGDEVVQLYVSDLSAAVPVPIRSLAGFERVSLKPGEKRTVRFTLAPRQLSVIDSTLKRASHTGAFEVAVGGKQPGFKGRADASTTQVLTARFIVQ